MEWLEAQKIELSIDLFAAAKQQLKFLGVVDQNRWLYDGPALERAVYRYNAYWLPLLAKYSESSSICEGPLVPPLDCEWVWHCHRLNPHGYKTHCEEFYGRVLDNSGVVSSVNGNCKVQTENLWKSMYPMEPYDLDLDKPISKPKEISVLEKCTTYDLVSAVKRQSTFYSEVSKARVNNDISMQEAVSRYKAFLYLIMRNREKSIKPFNVPTYDIDLIWHTHQLNPSSYSKDLEKIFGNILQHDDSNSDQSIGNKLLTGFSTTCAQWEETYGQKYCKPLVVAANCRGGVSCYGDCLAKAIEKPGASLKGVVEKTPVMAARSLASCLAKSGSCEAAEEHGACARSIALCLAEEHGVCARSLSLASCLVMDVDI